MDQARRELRIALFIAAHTFISSVHELGEILEEERDGKFQMHKTKCTAVVKNALGPCFKESLDEVMRGQPYSAMVDESTHVSSKKMLCVSVWFFNPTTKNLTDTFLDLEEIKDGSSKTIHQALLTILKQHGLDVKDCVKPATDGANAMCGKQFTIEQAEERHP